MAQKRMSPQVQSGARADLEEELKNAMTGEADIDSLNAAEVRRKFKYSGPGRTQPLKPPSIGGQILDFFRKKPAKKRK